MRPPPSKMEGGDNYYTPQILQIVIRLPNCSLPYSSIKQEIINKTRLLFFFLSSLKYYIIKQLDICQVAWPELSNAGSVKCKYPVLHNTRWLNHMNLVNMWCFFTYRESFINTPFLPEGYILPVGKMIIIIRQEFK